MEGKRRNLETFALSWCGMMRDAIKNKGTNSPKDHIFLVNQRSTCYLERTSSFSSLLRDAVLFWAWTVGLSAAEVHRHPHQQRPKRMPFIGWLSHPVDDKKRQKRPKKVYWRFPDCPNQFFWENSQFDPIWRSLYVAWFSVLNILW